MARSGRGYPIRGVTVLGPKFYPAAPVPGIPNVVVQSSRPASRVVPLAPMRRAIYGPSFIPQPPDPIGRIVRPFRQTPARVAARFFPQPTINRMEAPEVCRLNFVLTARANLDFELEVPHATLGREPLDFVIVNCRNEA